MYFETDDACCWSSNTTRPSVMIPSFSNSTGFPKANSAPCEHITSISTTVSSAGQHATPHLVCQESNMMIVVCLSIYLFIIHPFYTNIYRFHHLYIFHICPSKNCLGLKAQALLNRVRYCCLDHQAAWHMSFATANLQSWYHKCGTMAMYWGVVALGGSRGHGNFP